MTELDDELRLALTDDALDVSPLLARVRREMRPPRRFPMGAIAAALLLAIVSAVFTFVPQRSSRAIAADAACDHNDEVVRLRAKKWFTSPADVARYLNRRFPQSRDLVSTLTPPGASFEKVGTCRLHGVRFAHFVYRSSAEEISVFLRVTEAGEHLPPRFDYHDKQFGLEVAGFSTPRYEGLVVATLPAGPMRQIGDTLAGRLNAEHETAATIIDSCFHC